MDGNVMYHKMVEEVQFLELMLDSQHGTLTRAAPQRTYSAPANQFLIESDYGDENILKSCPANVEQTQIIGDASEDSMDCLESMVNDTVVADSPAIPDLKL